MKATTRKIVTFPMLVVLILTMTILTAGCSGNTECPVVVSQTSGIEVTELKTSFNEVPVGSTVILQAIFENKGTMTAENVEAKLWAFPGFGEPATGLTHDDIPDLAPPDLTICSPGDTYTVEWALPARCDPIKSTLAVVIDYDYTSEGFASFLLVSDKEAARTGGKFSERGENHPSAGPIQIEIEPLQTEPVIISNGSTTFDLRVTFKNSADGQVGPDGQGGLTSNNLEITGDCEFLDADGNYVLENGKPKKIVSLVDLKLSDVQLSFGKQEALKVISFNYTGTPEFLIKDFCALRIHSKYHYREFESTKDKIGVTGTTQQISTCRDKFQ